MRRMFEALLWNGFAGLWQRFEPENEVIHGGRHWVLPLLVSTLARSDEIAELAIAAVILNCEVPFLHIRETDLLRINTVSSDRKVPIARPRLLRVCPGHGGGGP